MENALKANPQDVRQEYEKQLNDLQEAYGEALLEILARTDPFSLGLVCRRQVSIDRLNRKNPGRASYQ